MHFLRRFGLGILLLLNSLAIFAQDSRTVASSTVSDLGNSNFKAVHGRFGDDLAKSISKKQLQTIWTQLTTAYGQFEKAEEGEFTIEDGSTKALIPIQFESGSMTLQLKIEGEWITGIYFASNSYVLPASVKGVSFGKKQLTVGADTFKLDAELVVPRTPQKCPVVILVHGSGPMDMDESVYASKVFKDLSLMLATQGVATLRYDKRSKTYPHLFESGKDFTLGDETVDDALSAVQVAKSLDLIDTNRVFVLGHSLGAYAVPRIIKMDPTITGGIVMAGPARKLFEILPEQYDYLLGRDGKLSFIDKMILRKMDKAVEQLRGLPDDVPERLKIPMAYWPIHFFVDIHGYDPVVTVKQDTRPFLILQGELDYQVSYANDFSRFKTELKGEPRVEMISYPELDHLMMDAQGESTPSDYFQMRNVEPEVVQDIAKWVLGQE